ncbi:MAG TPA: hypothetical protein VFD98_03100 [Terracidiphilus sp.]|nr:hypothetical protein [Terracidiphilus sp.]
MNVRFRRWISAGMLAGLIAGLLATRSAAAEQLQLVIAASSPSPAGIAEKAKQLSAQFKNGLVIQTSECGDEHNVYAFVSGIEDSRAEAQSLLASTRASIPDAYIKECRLKPDSLLGFRVPAVDSSIADVPAGAVNWSDEDRISTASPLPDGRTLILVRYYAHAADDPQEGRRERVILGDPSDKTTVLDENCTRAGKAAVTAGRIAFDCAVEQAGDHLLHAVKAFDDSGSKLKEIQHCRKPRWEQKNLLACDEESVGADGKLVLTAKQTEIP